MQRAGYDPKVMPRFFELYKRYKPQADAWRVWQHPPTDYRTKAAVEETARDLEGSPVTARPVRRLREIQRLLANRP